VRGAPRSHRPAVLDRGPQVGRPEVCDRAPQVSANGGHAGAGRHDGAGDPARSAQPQPSFHQGPGRGPDALGEMDHGMAGRPRHDRWTSSDRRRGPEYRPGRSLLEQQQPAFLQESPDGRGLRLAGQPVSGRGRRPAERLVRRPVSVGLRGLLRQPIARPGRAQPGRRRIQRDVDHPGGRMVLLPDRGAGGLHREPSQLQPRRLRRARARERARGAARTRSRRGPAAGGGLPP
jgi:hypothetical protein